jgi:16S rRNA (adenine1518-N6/adenine1519-N6)-dimethyltransferase
MKYISSENKQKYAMPKHSLGQNFLINRNIVEKILTEADVTGKNVLEIGPGRGALTVGLVETAKKIVAIEKDRDLAESLAEMIQNENFKLISDDVLKVAENEWLEFFGSKKYIVVANLPYNITSAFLQRFLELDNPPEEMILMVQREVAERIVGRDNQSGVLTMSVAFYADPEILFRVSPGSFFPAPKIESAVIRLKNIRKNKFDVEAEKFFQFVKAGFSSRRKLLKSNLAKGLGLPQEAVLEAFKKVGVKETVRAEELSVGEWVKFITAIS